MFMWGETNTIIFFKLLNLSLFNFSIDIVNNRKIGIKYLPWTPLINSVWPGLVKYMYCDIKVKQTVNKKIEKITILNVEKKFL